MTDYSPDPDVPTVVKINERLVTGAKPHVCDDCFGPIPKGIRYRRIAWKVDGEIRVTTTHLGCRF